MKDELAEEMRRASTDKVATFHPTAADRLLQGAAHIESLEAKLEKAREIAERLVDQRDEPVCNETQRLHYWRDKAIKSAQALKEISQ